MSGDVQPRKRKEKRRKKDSEEVPTSFTSDEQLHVHKDASTGGNICAKILFFLLSFVLLVMIGLVVFEYRGVADDETLVPVSKWAATFDGWLETPVKHDEHADVTGSGEQEHGESREHESVEGEEHVSEEAGSKEDEEEEEGEEEDEEEEEEEEEEKGSEEEETKSEEEEEEDEEADKLEDEESEEVDENETDDRDEDYEQEEEEDEESEEDVYEHEKSEEDLEAEKEDTDDDGDEEDEEEDVEVGKEELDDEEERETSAYQHESNEINDVLSEIPGITESDEDEEGDNLGRSDEITDELPKIPGVNEKKIKAVSEEEVDVPRQKREKEVSETTKPVEGTSTIKGGQKPLQQPKSPDQGQAKLKSHRSSIDHKGVTEKPIVPKHEKPEALHPQEQPASKSKHRTQPTELPPTKNDGFPSGPGETGPGQKDDITASKVTPPKKQKGGLGTIKDSPSEATLPKMQKEDTGPTLKSEPLPADPSKPTVSGGKNLKDKDVSSDGAHSAPKASQIGDKLEHSPKVGKSGTVHKVIEQSSSTKLDENDRVSVSKSPEVGKSTEEIKKPVEVKDKQGSKSVHSASASGVKNREFDKQRAQTTTDETVKISDLKVNARGNVGSAGISASSDEKDKAASNAKEKENVRVEQQIRERRNSNSQTKQALHSTDEKQLGEQKKDRPSTQDKINNEQFSTKSDRQAERVVHVAAKDSSVSKGHGDPKKSEVDIEKEKASVPTSGKMSGDGTIEVPTKVSTDKIRQASADNTKNRAPEKSADVNATKKKSGNDNPPPGDAHLSKPRDTKESAVPEPTSKHSVRKSDISKTQEPKPSVQSAASHKNNRDEVVRPTPASENRAGRQENSGNNKPVNSNIKKPSQDRKVTSKRTENEVTQPKSERSSGRKEVPPQRDSDSETVGGEIKSSKMSQDKAVEEEEEEEEEEGEDEPEPSGVPKARKLQKEDDDSGSDKEIPVTKSKIPKNMGGQNAQVYSKADLTNEDDWHIIQDLDRADDDADEDLNF